MLYNARYYIISVRYQLQTLLSDYRAVRYGVVDRQNGVMLSVSVYRQDACNLPYRLGVHVAVNTGIENAPVIDLYTAENPVIAGRKARIVCHSFNRRRLEFTWLRNGQQLKPHQQQQQQQRYENVYTVSRNRDQNVLL